VIQRLMRSAGLFCPRSTCRRVGRFQYAFRSSGDIPDSGNPWQRVGNEAVMGVRTNIVF
jgi:hypothetical protein